MAKTPSWRVTEAQKNYAWWQAFIILAMFIYIIGYNLIDPAGNPITKLKVEKAAEEYLQANHPQVFRQGRHWKHDTYYYETEDGKWWEYRFYGNYTDDDSINGSPQLCFSLLYDGESFFHQPAFRVRAVDTTAAGDSYLGGLCAALASGAALREAMGYASAVAACAVQKPGALPSLPDAEQVRRLLEESRR